jgi:hypothetical protein
VSKAFLQCAALFCALEGHRFKDILSDLDSLSLNLYFCQEIGMATIYISPQFHLI